jgi:hypothetical protein
MDLWGTERPHTLAEVALMLAVAGGALTIVGAYRVWRGLDTRGWRPADGEVTGAVVSGPEQLTPEERDGLNLKGFYLPRVFYKYTVHGREYEGHVLQDGLFGLPFRSLADKQIAEYEPGQKVAVYVSPRDVRQAVLKRGAPAQAFVLLAGGIALLVLAFICY